MGRSRLVLAAAALAASAALAATVTAAEAAEPAAPAQAAAGTVDVKFAVDRFVRQGKTLVARGAVVATYTPPTGAATKVTKPFTGKLRVNQKMLGGRTLAASTRICEVLYLQLDKLRLELLGLIVDLDKVVLTIKANSRGGALGSLFCSLANAKVNVRTLSSHAKRLTQAARQSGLATSGLGFAVPLAKSAAAQEGPCKVLDLILGPLDLRLLGLNVHLNRVHLTITAVPGGGVLGDLFCGLAGGPDVPLPPVPTTG